MAYLGLHSIKANVMYISTANILEMVADTPTTTIAIKQEDKFELSIGKFVADPIFLIY